MAASDSSQISEEAGEVPEVDSMGGQREEICNGGVGMEGVEPLLQGNILRVLPQFLQLVILHLPHRLTSTHLFLVFVLGHGALGRLRLKVEQVGHGCQNTHCQRGAL